MTTMLDDQLADTTAAQFREYAPLLKALLDVAQRRLAELRQKRVSEWTDCDRENAAALIGGRALPAPDAILGSLLYGDGPAQWQELLSLADKGNWTEEEFLRAEAIVALGH